MNWKRILKWSWPNLRFWCGIQLEELRKSRKTQASWCHVQNSNHTPGWKSEATLLKPICTVTLHTFVHICMYVSSLVKYKIQYEGCVTERICLMPPSSSHQCLPEADLLNSQGLISEQYTVQTSTCHLYNVTCAKLSLLNCLYINLHNNKN